jgi:hypothetical protein
MSKAKQPRGGSQSGPQRPARSQSGPQRRQNIPSADQRRKAAQRAVIDARRGGNRWLYTALPVAVVVILVAVLVIVKVAQGPSNSEGTARTALPDSIAAQIANVPADTLNSVGLGTATASNPSVVANPTLMTEDGKIRVLYIGAEYCPYCAGERWAMAVALSKFGSFAGLKQTASSSADVHPSTPTLSFYQASYTSDTVAFQPYETATNSVKNGSYETLETVSPADTTISGQYNTSPYVSTPGAIPFIDIGGKYIFSGASFDVSVLSGMSHAAIGNALSTANSAVAKAIDGAANEIMAAICGAMSNPPAAVCTLPGVQTATAELNGLTPVGAGQPLPSTSGASSSSPANASVPTSGATGATSSAAA